MDKTLKKINWCIDEFKTIIIDPETSEPERKEAVEYLIQSVVIKCVLSLPKDFRN